MKKMIFSVFLLVFILTGCNSNSERDDITKVLIYGRTFETESEIRVEGPYLTGENGNALLPEINNGYYRLIDRQEDDGRDILSRESMNFKLMIYDEGNKTLYYCEMDT